MNRGRNHYERDTRRATAMLLVHERGRLTARDLAHATGWTAALALRTLKDLADAGGLVATKDKRYDPMGGWGANLFGGAAVCVRRFWVFTLPTNGGK